MSAGHRHPPQPDLEDQPLGAYQALATAVEALLVEKGVLTAAEIRDAIERYFARGPADGARLVARAWVDPAFAKRLFADVRAAAAEFGIDTGSTPIAAMPNTPALHHVVVCTLCSCYPTSLLGPSPDWYKSRAYRSRMVREPRAVLAEFGTAIPETVEVRVHDSSADVRYFVVPVRPAGSDGLGEAELAPLVTRDCLIGVKLPNVG